MHTVRPQEADSAQMDRNWTPNPPATSAEIEKLKKAVPFELPEAYLGILSKYNGGEGEIALLPMWLQLWSVDEVIESYGLEFFRKEFPGYFFFASNGGMESIAMRKSAYGAVEIVMLDANAGLSSAEVIASDFGSFDEAIGKVYEA
jgi:hypothetical protein